MKIKIKLEENEILTNGDLIRTLFPNVKWWVNEDNEVFTDMPYKPEKRIYFDCDWWKSAFRKLDNNNIEVS